MKIGLALGSGGARGWCHIGVLRTLEVMGIKPDLISGCSMGALVGAAYAGGCLDRLESWVEDLSPSRFAGLLDIRLNSGGIVGGKEIHKLLDDIDLPTDFEDLTIPFAAVATEMESGECLWLQDGSVQDAVRASVALPGVISPHKIGERWFLDGGLTDPVPVAVLRDMGADVVIAVNPNARPDNTMWVKSQPAWKGKMQKLPEPLSRLVTGREDDIVPNYFEVITVSIDVMTEQVRRFQLDKTPADLMLNPDLIDMSVLEMHRGAKAIAEGRRVTEEQADQISKLCRP